MTTIRVKENEPFDVALRRFKRTIEKLGLLTDLRARFGMSYLFISHDLGVVRHISDRIAVMRHGKLVEEGEADRVFATPRHPYTRALLAAVPAATPAARRARDTAQQRRQERALT